MDSTEAAIHSRWKSIGFDALLPEEQGYVAVWWFAIEVNNGGFDQYFHNNSGDSALLALDALEQSGAKETSSLLSKALCAFEPVGGYVAGRKKRIKLLGELPADHFDTLDSQFYAGQEAFMSKVLSRVTQAKAHAEV